MRDMRDIMRDMRDMRISPSQLPYWAAVCSYCLHMFPQLRGVLHPSLEEEYCSRINRAKEEVLTGEDDQHKLEVLLCGIDEDVLSRSAALNVRNAAEKKHK